MSYRMNKPRSLQPFQARWQPMQPRINEIMIDPMQYEKAGQSYAFGNMAYASYFNPNPQIPNPTRQFSVLPVNYSQGQYRYLNPAMVMYPGPVF
jgi:hypothetical protein